MAGDYLGGKYGKMDNRQALAEAIRQGDLPKTKTLISEHPPLLHALGDDRIPLTMLAAYYRQMELFSWMIAQKKVPTLYEAVVDGYTARVSQLLEHTPELVNEYTPDGHTPLGLACYFDRPVIARLLLSYGADVNQPSANGARVAPLHSAVAAGSLEITLLLLENGAEVNGTQQGSITALHSAAHRGRADLVELLLQYGADPAARMDDGRTPLDFARADGHEETLRVLLGQP